MDFGLGWGLSDDERAENWRLWRPGAFRPSRVDPKIGDALKPRVQT